MPKLTIQEAVARKGANPVALARKVAREPGLLPEVFDGLNAARARVK